MHEGGGGVSVQRNALPLLAPFLLLTTCLAALVKGIPGDTCKQTPEVRGMHTMVLAKGGPALRSKSSISLYLLHFASEIRLHQPGTEVSAA